MKKNCTFNTCIEVLSALLLFSGLKGSKRESVKTLPNTLYRGTMVTVALRVLSEYARNTKVIFC